MVNTFEFKPNNNFKNLSHKFLDICIKQNDKVQAYLFFLQIYNNIYRDLLTD